MGGSPTLRTIAAAPLLILGGCTFLHTERTLGPAEVKLAPRAHLKLARDLIFLPPEEGVKLMHRLGERPGAPVLGVVLTTEAVPRMMILFDAGRDERGVPKVDFVGWDETPAARSFIDELTGMELAKRPE